MSTDTEPKPLTAYVDPLAQNYPQQIHCAFKSVSHVDLVPPALARGCRVLSIVSCGLPTARGLSGFPDLRSLCLANNRLESLDDLRAGLARSRLTLEALDISGNPVCTRPGYRAALLSDCPALISLDGVPVTAHTRTHHASQALAERALLPTLLTLALWRDALCQRTLRAALHKELLARAGAAPAVFLRGGAESADWDRLREIAMAEAALTVTPGIAVGLTATAAAAPHTPVQHATSSTTRVFGPALSPLPAPTTTRTNNTSFHKSTFHHATSSSLGASASANTGADASIAETLTNAGALLGAVESRLLTIITTSGGDIANAAAAAAAAATPDKPRARTHRAGAPRPRPSWRRPTASLFSDSESASDTDADADAAAAAAAADDSDADDARLDLSAINATSGKDLLPVALRPHGSLGSHAAKLVAAAACPCALARSLLSRWSPPATARDWPPLSLSAATNGTALNTAAAAVGATVRLDDTLNLSTSVAPANGAYAAQQSARMPPVMADASVPLPPWPWAWAPALNSNAASTHNTLPDSDSLGSDAAANPWGCVSIAFRDLWLRHGFAHDPEHSNSATSATVRASPWLAPCGPLGEPAHAAATVSALVARLSAVYAALHTAAAVATTGSASSGGGVAVSTSACPLCASIDAATAASTAAADCVNDSSDGDGECAADDAALHALDASRCGAPRGHAAHGASHCAADHSRRLDAHTPHGTAKRRALTAFTDAETAPRAAAADPCVAAAGRRAARGEAFGKATASRAGKVQFTLGDGVAVAAARIVLRELTDRVLALDRLRRAVLSVDPFAIPSPSVATSVSVPRSAVSLDAATLALSLAFGPATGTTPGTVVAAFEARLWPTASASQRRWDWRAPPRLLWPVLLPSEPLAGPGVLQWMRHMLTRGVVDCSDLERFRSLLPAVAHAEPRSVPALLLRLLSATVSANGAWQSTADIARARAVAAEAAAAAATAHADAVGLGAGAAAAAARRDRSELEARVVAAERAAAAAQTRLAAATRAGAARETELQSRIAAAEAAVVPDAATAFALSAKIEELQNELVTAHAALLAAEATAEAREIEMAAMRLTLAKAEAERDEVKAKAASVARESKTVALPLSGDQSPPTLGSPGSGINGGAVVNIFVNSPLQGGSGGGAAPWLQSPVRTAPQFPASTVHVSPFTSPTAANQHKPQAQQQNPDEGGLAAVPFPSLHETTDNVTDVTTTAAASVTALAKAAEAEAIAVHEVKRRETLEADLAVMLRDYDAIVAKLQNAEREVKEAAQRGDDALRCKGEAEKRVAELEANLATALIRVDQADRRVAEASSAVVAAARADIDAAVAAAKKEAAVACQEDIDRANAAAATARVAERAATMEAEAALDAAVEARARAAAAEKRIRELSATESTTSAAAVAVERALALAAETRATAAEARLAELEKRAGVAETSAREADARARSVAADIKLQTNASVTALIARVDEAEATAAATTHLAAAAEEHAALLNTKLADANARAASADSQVRELAARCAEARQEAASATTALAAARSAAPQQSTAEKDRSAVLGGLVASLSKELVESQTMALRKAADEADARARASVKRVGKLEVTLADAELRVGVAQAETATLAQKLSAAQIALKTATEQLSRAESDAFSARELMQRSTQRVAEIEARFANLETQNKAALQRASDADAALVTIKSALLSAAADSDALVLIIAERDAVITKLQSELDCAKADAAAARSQAAKIQADAAVHAARLRREAEDAFVATAAFEKTLSETSSRLAKTELELAAAREEANAARLAATGAHVAPGNAADALETAQCRAVAAESRVSQLESACADILRDNAAVKQFAADAEKRAEAAEQRVTKAAHDVVALTHRAEAATERANAAEQRVNTLQQEITSAQQHFSTAEQRVAELEQHGCASEQRGRDAEQRVKELQDHVSAVEQRAQEAEQRAARAEADACELAQHFATIDSAVPADEHFAQRLAEAERVATSAHDRAVALEAELARAGEVLSFALGGSGAGSDGRALDRSDCAGLATAAAEALARLRRLCAEDEAALASTRRTLLQVTDDSEALILDNDALVSRVRELEDALDALTDGAPVDSVNAGDFDFSGPELPPISEGDEAARSAPSSARTQPED